MRLKKKIKFKKEPKKRLKSTLDPNHKLETNPIKVSPKHNKENFKSQNNKG